MTMEPERESVTTQSTVFPASGRRVIFYLLFDVRGDVDDYVVYKLERLRPFTEHLFVVVNGTLSATGRAKLEPVADTILVRDNVGFDVWGYKTALEAFGDERLAEFDELILMNYTWFGPVNPFEPVFERMNAAEVDFWGMTDHAGSVPNPFTLTGEMHQHIQSHWIAVRRRMFTSEAWKSYWRDMPMIESYTQSILSHESVFTHHFKEAGFVAEVAFPLENYPSDHPAFLDATALLHDGCPALKRRPFFHSPLYLDREAVISRWTLEVAEGYGYPMPLLFENMARNAEPKVLNTDASMLEILPEVDVQYDAEHPLRIAAIVHIFYEDLTDELLDRLITLPSPVDLYVTTTNDEKAAIISEAIARRAEPGIAAVEIRVLPSNRGRDLSAFYVACRDVLLSDDYDLVVKIHSKKTVQQRPNAGEFFKRQQLENLLNSPGYTANLGGLFQKEPGLGLVFPPTIHIGFPTMGHAWFANKEPTQELADELGIRVPLDEISPLAPLGAMFIARPQALRLLAETEWGYEDYLPESEHRDGSLAHVQERIVTYAAAELGYHTRTVATATYAAISHTFLEYKLDQMSSAIEGYPIDQIHMIRGLMPTAVLGPVAYAKQDLRRHRPKLASFLFALYKPARAVYRGARSVRSRLRGAVP